MENNFCRSCGAQLDPGAQFCKQCGAPSADAPAAVPAGGAREVPILKKKKGGWLKWLLIAAAVIVVIVIVASAGGGGTEYDPETDVKGVVFEQMGPRRSGTPAWRT